MKIGLADLELVELDLFLEGIWLEAFTGALEISLKDGFRRRIR